MYVCLRVSDITMFKSTMFALQKQTENNYTHTKCVTGFSMCLCVCALNIFLAYHPFQKYLPVDVRTGNLKR